MKGCLKKKKNNTNQNQQKPPTNPKRNKTDKKKKKNHQNNNMEVFPPWDCFQTKNTYVYFKGPSSEKEICRI